MNGSKSVMICGENRGLLKNLGGHSRIAIRHGISFIPPNATYAYESILKLALCVSVTHTLATAASTLNSTKYPINIRSPAPFLVRQNINT